jgi:S-ribosylhomocysteine lyase
MERIASFCINHDTLVEGMYLSRVDGDVYTYDVRFVRPNTPPYLPTDAMHTIEHLVATYVRNSVHKDSIIYFGPMGCRTGFYFRTRGISHEQAIGLMAGAMAFIAGYEGEIPGVSPEECGNWLEHDLEGARKWAAGILNRMDSPDRLLFVCYEAAGSDEPIGFLYGKIDREGDRGYVRPGWGYVMEFYVRPAFRRRGYGREMTAHLEEWFASRNVRRLYLTADPVTGVPFWGALGYTDSGTVSPENGQTIFEKTI